MVLEASEAGDDGGGGKGRLAGLFGVDWGVYGAVADADEEVVGGGGSEGLLIHMCDLLHGKTESERHDVPEIDNPHPTLYYVSPRRKSSQCLVLPLTSAGLILYRYRY